ncbi:hypothetical protein GX888_01455 [Candidatus Dojkabacteria bacterium]|uniref:DUF4145 domain-containing protein n=1 Tax=Candidatus Dojkabacteria bacterium TaxID=2099670 RepID=A0A847VD53_9BACT|nr:hypothetical protein [Candidatus Dojkabacteria bacterium]
MSNHLLTTIVILGLVAILFLATYIQGKTVSHKRKDRIYTSLDELENQVKSEDMYARRDSIIRLDNLLAKALRIRLNNQKDCGENLKNAKNMFTKNLYQNLWKVHKIRNDIVHRDRDIDYEEATYAYRIYKLGIKRILK